MFNRFYIALVLNSHLFTKYIAYTNKYLIFISHINYIYYICIKNNKDMANTELRIKELCRERGITQAQLADKLGIQPVSFSQAVSRNKFNMDRLSEIADALGVEIPELFENSKKDTLTINCPHCGKSINIKVE